jgi:hypothetical protein
MTSTGASRKISTTNPGNTSKAVEYFDKTDFAAHSEVYKID